MCHSYLIIDALVRTLNLLFWNLILRGTLTMGEDFSQAKIANLVCFSVTGVYVLIIALLFYNGSREFKQSLLQENIHYNASDNMKQFIILERLALATILSFIGICTSRIITEIYNSSWQDADTAAFYIVGTFTTFAVFFFFTFYISRLKYSFLESIYVVSNKFCIILVISATFADIWHISPQW